MVLNISGVQLNPHQQEYKMGKPRQHKVPRKMSVRQLYKPLIPYMKKELNMTCLKKQMALLLMLSKIEKGNLLRVHDMRALLRTLSEDELKSHQLTATLIQRILLDYRQNRTFFLQYHHPIAVKNCMEDLCDEKENMRQKIYFCLKEIGCESEKISH